MTSNVSVIFEVDHLEYVSPAMISRCGMIFVDATDFSWMAYVKSWSLSLFEDRQMFPSLKQELRKHIVELFSRFAAAGLKFITNLSVGGQFIKTTPIGIITTMCRMIAGLMLPEYNYELGNAASDRAFLTKVFIFTFVWAIGGTTSDLHLRNDFDIFARDLFDIYSDVEIPHSTDVFGMFIDPVTQRFISWEALMPVYVFDPQLHLSLNLIPTIDTVRYQYLMELLLRAKGPLLVAGQSGVCKSMMLESILLKLEKEPSFKVATYQLGPKVQPKRLQKLIEGNLVYASGGTEMVPANGKRLLVFLDNLSVPTPDQFGTQVRVLLLCSFL